jgi:hypothetical protein
MRLHRKIALNLALVVVGLIVIFYLLSTFVLMDEFSSLEYHQAQSDMGRVYTAYRTEQQSLEGITRDWSSWDDTYDFIETASTAYLSSNMVDGTFVNNRLNAVLYINRSISDRTNGGIFLRISSRPWRRKGSSVQLCRMNRAGPILSGLLKDYSYSPPCQSSPARIWARPVVCWSWGDASIPG